MPPSDAVRLMHMIEALHHCQIVGEAAANITETTRRQYPQVPWDKIVGMRNRIVHAYFDINLDVLWDTATIDIPQLLSVLKTVSFKS